MVGRNLRIGVKEKAMNKYLALAFLILLSGCASVQGGASSGSGDGSSKKLSKEDYYRIGINETYERKVVYEESPNTELIQVFFGTNREAFISPSVEGKVKEHFIYKGKYSDDRLLALNPSKYGEIHFGYKKDENKVVHYGRTLVSVPKNFQREKGNLQPWWLVEEVRIVLEGLRMRDVIKDNAVMLEEVSVLSPEKFLKNIKGYLNSSHSDKTALVFVHGFGVTWEDAARRTAQMSYDLEYDGVPIFFSWPSKGQISKRAYKYDYDLIDESVPYLEKFLMKIVNSEAEKIFLIAHSMGNIGLVQAITNIGKELGHDKLPVFTEIILTAPDMNSGTFEDFVEKFQMAGKRVTLYSNSEDVALEFSREHMHGGLRRAGDSKPEPITIKGMDSIDATNMNTGFISINHSYPMENRDVIEDISYLLRGVLAKDRFGLEPIKTYWVFKP